MTERAPARPRPGKAGGRCAARPRPPSAQRAGSSRRLLRPGGGACDPCRGAVPEPAARARRRGRAHPARALALRARLGRTAPAPRVARCEGALTPHLLGKRGPMRSHACCSARSSRPRAWRRCVPRVYGHDGHNAARQDGRREERRAHRPRQPQGRSARVGEVQPRRCSASTGCSRPAPPAPSCRPRRTCRSPASRADRWAATSRWAPRSPRASSTSSSSSGTRSSRSRTIRT